MYENKASTETHLPTGHCAKTRTIAVRRTLGAVNARLPAPVCPRMRLTRRNSSNSVFFCQVLHIVRIASDGAELIAFSPARVSVSFLPESSASFPPCSKRGQANGL